MPVAIGLHCYMNLGRLLSFGPLPLTNKAEEALKVDKLLMQLPTAEGFKWTNEQRQIIVAMDRGKGTSK